MAIRIALIGFGKIARDQHVPAIQSDARFELVAVTSRSTAPGIGVPAFTDLDHLLATMPGGLDAVAICTPPDVRHGIARKALDAGLAVLLEKPPAATLGEASDLLAFADVCRCTIYAGWHSQHAPAVKPAAAMLRNTGIRRLHIDWHEDVRKWHPDQDWVWAAGGFGVFDPGINALSIVTAIIVQPLIVRSARLQVPGNRQAPIAADLQFAGAAHTASFDWRHTDGERWTIAIDTDDGRSIEVRDGGAGLAVDGQDQPIAQISEYPAIYGRFAELVAAHQSEIDIEPLRIVADAFLIGSRTEVAPFAWTGQT